MLYKSGEYECISDAPIGVLLHVRHAIYKSVIPYSCMFVSEL
jgi:hypothetical protein